MRHVLDSFTFEDHGRQFEAEIFPDDIGPPWEEHDGHGVVSKHEYHAFGQGSKPPKRPGERILYWERGTYRTYDMQATTARAWKDGWGLSDKAVSELSDKLKRPATRGDIVHQAVENDFKRMRGWCNDDWCWVTVHVTDLASGDDEYLGGVESDGDYWRECAREMASSLHPLAEAHEAADLETCTD